MDILRNWVWYVTLFRRKLLPSRKLFQSKISYFLTSIFFLGKKMNCFDCSRIHSIAFSFFFFLFLKGYHHKACSNLSYLYKSKHICINIFSIELFVWKGKFPVGPFYVFSFLFLSPNAAFSSLKIIKSKNK